MFGLVEWAIALVAISVLISVLIVWCWFDGFRHKGRRRHGRNGCDGRDGCDGNDGCDGRDGQDGQNGAQGRTGPQGVQGSFGGPQGPQGGQGAQGTPGAQGAQGTPGSQGAQGTPGSQGAQGAAGAQGTQGAAGGQGAQGPAGGTGTQGAQGGVGPTGDAGGVGPTGPTGPAGGGGTGGTLGSGGRFPFSTGTIVTSAVTDAIPLVLGFGNSRVYTIGAPFNFLGESTIPQEIGQYAIPIPFDGIVHNLEIGGDIFITATITEDLIYEIGVLRASVGSNNAGAAYIQTSPALYYRITPLFSTLTFPLSFTAPVELSATNLNTGTLPVTAGDRIAIRIIVRQGAAANTAQVTRLGFNASLSYTPL